MKYLTKEWYAKMGDESGYSEIMKEIPDGDYAEADIEKLYAEELDKWIRDEREYYNTPPDIDYELELLENPELTLSDWCFIIGEDEHAYHPKSKAEIRTCLQQAFKKRLNEFESRSPFNPSEAIADFEDRYRSYLEHHSEILPEWVCEQVDSRLLALNLMPQSALTQLKKEERNKQRAFQRMNEKMGPALSEARSKIPTDIRENFGYHDACILSFKKINQDYCMTLRLDGDIYYQGDTPYLRLWFRNAKVLEREKGITIRQRKYKDSEYWSNCHWLYEELYRLDDGGYEVHMMLWVGEPKYLTLQCREIVIEPDITYPNQTQH